jgi:hypothetical protein
MLRIEENSDIDEPKSLSLRLILPSAEAVVCLLPRNCPLQHSDFGILSSDFGILHSDFDILCSDFFLQKIKLCNEGRMDIIIACWRRTLTRALGATEWIEQP